MNNEIEVYADVKYITRAVCYILDAAQVRPENRTSEGVASLAATLRAQGVQHAERIIEYELKSRQEG